MPFSGALPTVSSREAHKEISHGNGIGEKESGTQGLHVVRSRVSLLQQNRIGT